jgi:hypothetical protein
VCIVRVVAIIAMFPELTRCHAVQVMHESFASYPSLPIGLPMLAGRWALGPSVSAWAAHVGVRTPSTARDSYSGQERIKGMKSTRWIQTPILLPSCTRLFIFFLRFWASKFSPPIATMASHLPRSRLCTKADLVVLRRVLGLQSPGYDDWVRCGAFPLVPLQPGELAFFSCYAVVGLVPPISSFLLTLLEFYGL